MIITLIAVALLIVGIIYLIIENSTYRYRMGWFEYIGFPSFLIGMLSSMFILAFIMTININRDIDYQNKLYEREMLEYRIEKMEENITGNEMLYNDIVEFNNELRSTKKWANNPWTNWFNNQDIATIDYIEIDKD